MKHFFSLLILLTASFALYAQQLNTSSFYELYGVLHNPATAGSNGKATIGGSFKTQWSSMPGSPKTGLLFGQVYIPQVKLGLGGYLYHDVTGPTSRNGVQMAYAYQIPVTGGTHFSLGLEARLQQLQFDRAKLQEALGTNDPVAIGAANRLKADAGFGLAYTSPAFQIGASVSQLAQSHYDLYERTGTTTAQSQFYRHYYLHGYYHIPLDEASQLTPNALIIYLPNAPTEIQTGVRMDYNNLFWYGLSWRARQGWMIAAGLQVKEKLSIGYSFDIYSSPLSVYEKGSSGHELLLRYEFQQP